MAVVVAVIMVVAMVMTVCVAPGLVGPALGLEAGLFFRHRQVHAAQHLGQHGVGFELQAVGAQVHRHVAVAQVVGGAQQV